MQFSCRCHLTGIHRYVGIGSFGLISMRILAAQIRRLAVVISDILVTLSYFVSM